jgi:hypothetical protein
LHTYGSRQLFDEEEFPARQLLGRVVNQCILQQYGKVYSFVQLFYDCRGNRITLPDSATLDDVQRVHPLERGTVLSVFAYFGMAIWVTDNIASDVGDPWIHCFPQSVFDGASCAFEVLCAYLRRGGYKSGELVRALGARIGTGPFMDSFTRLVERQRITLTDLFLIREEIRGLIHREFMVELKSCFNVLGIVCSNLVLGFADTERHGGPFDPIPSAAMRLRSTMTICLGALVIGPLMYDPQNGPHFTTGRPKMQRSAGFRSYDQVTVALVDTSGTMCSIAPYFKVREGESRRKLWLANAFLEIFFRTATECQVPSLFGIATFSEPFKVQWDLEITQVPKFTGRGPGKLSEFLGNTISDLGRFQGLKRRILLITDGEDRSELKLELCRTVIRNGIQLDVIVLASHLSDNGDLAPFRRLIRFCHFTGGQIFRPNEMAAAAELLTDEAFVNLSMRRVPDQSSVKIEEEDLQGMYGNFDESVKFLFKQGDMLQDEVEGEVPTNYREQRIKEEFAQCRRNGIPAFRVSGFPGVWRIFIDLPGFHLECLWDVLVLFPPQYPYIPPLFRYLSIPDATRCRRIDLPKYHPRMSLVQVIAQIQKLEGKAQWTQQKLQQTWRTFRRKEAIPLPTIRYLREINMKNPRPVGREAPASEVQGLEYSQVTWREFQETERSIAHRGFVIPCSEDALLE